MRKTFTMQEEHWSRVKDLSRTALNTPVLVVGGRDISETAFNLLYAYWAEILPAYACFPDAATNILDQKARLVEAVWGEDVEGGVA